MMTESRWFVKSDEVFSFLSCLKIDEGLVLRKAKEDFHFQEEIIEN